MSADGGPFGRGCCWGGDDEAFFEEIDDGCGCGEFRESMTERRRRRE